MTAIFVRGAWVGAPGHGVKRQRISFPASSRGRYGATMSRAAIKTEVGTVCVPAI
jgi:hypothetical protein